MEQVHIECTADQKLALAREGGNISETIRSIAGQPRYTYLAYSSGKVKVGSSITPLSRGARFGEVRAIFMDAEVERWVHRNMCHCEPPANSPKDGKTEWVLESDVHLIFDFANTYKISFLRGEEISPLTVPPGRVNLSTTLPPEVSLEVENMAKESGRTVSQVLRDLVIIGLNEVRKTGKLFGNRTFLGGLK